MIRARKTVERVEEYTPQPEGRLGMIRLDLNENTVGCPAELVRAIRRVITPEWCAVYPEYEKSHETLARYFGVSPAELMMTNGVDDAIMLICDTFVDPGDALVIPSPTFSIYQFFHEVRGGVTRAVNYDRNVCLPLDKLISAGRRARWMALANPNNPTGTLVPPEDLKTLIEALPETLVLVDEAYFDFSGVTILPWIRCYPNLIVSRTFSKAFGLAALRIGLLFANKKLMGLMRRIHAVYAVNGLAAACAAESVHYDQAMRRVAATVCRSREAFYRDLERFKIPYMSSSANFVLTRVGPEAQEIAARLRKQRILVRSWSNEPRLKRCLRMTIGSAPQMRRLTDALAGLVHLINPDKPRNRTVAGGAMGGWFS
ncbi:MAG: pyridoxal phosphate-dependent aminotransferase [Terriglobia bacterium]